MTVGVFDSGLGGLSVLKHLKQQLGHESFLYVADSAHAPYGDKTESFIRQRCEEISGFLIEQGVSAIVVACNTATAAAVDIIRQKHDVPVVAIEPALKPASQITRTGKIGVLATASTLNSQQYQRLVKNYTSNLDCFEQAAHGLVEQVEAGLLDDEKTNRLLQQYLQPMLEQGVDSIVLGCTHYPFLLSAIKAITGQSVEVIDTGYAVAEQLKNVLKQTQRLQTTQTLPEHHFYSSGNTLHAQDMIKKLLDLNVTVNPLSV